MNYIKRLLLSFVGLLPYFVMAQVDTSDIVRPVASAWEIGVGHTSIADTYLSPLQYDGMGIDLRYERRRAMSFNPDKWTMVFDASVGVDTIVNTACIGKGCLDYKPHRRIIMGNPLGKTPTCVELSSYYTHHWTIFCS